MGVVFNPLTYLLLATVTEDPSFGGFIFYLFLIAFSGDIWSSPVLVGWCADFCATPSEPKVSGAEVEGHATRVVLVLPGV